MIKKKKEQTENAIIEEPPLLPSAAKFAWSYFMRLNQTRQVGGFGGFFAINYQEMWAFFQLEQVMPEPYELELIRIWDGIALKHLNKEKKKTNK